MLYGIEINQGSDCDFAEVVCKTKADCAKPCKALGHSPIAVICVPNDHGSTHCCCIIAASIV